MAKIDLRMSAEVADAVAGLRQVAESVGQMGERVKPASFDLKDLTGTLNIAKQAFGAVSGAVQSVVGPVVDYSKNIRDLSAFTGISTEESSRLINVADDLQIEYGTLRTASRKLIEDGLQPNIDTLADLSDQYLAIQDPVERSQFLIETFGSRAGPDMARMMEQGSAAIRASAKEAEDLGLVMDEKGVASAQRYTEAMDKFNDTLLGVKIAIAENVLGPISDSIEQGAEYVQLWKNVTAAVADGRMGLGEWITTSAQVVWTDKTVADVNAELTASQNEQTAAVDATTARYQGLADQYTTTTVPATVEYSNQIQSQTAYLNDLVPAIDSTRVAGELLAAGLSGVMTQAFDDFHEATANTVPALADNAGWLETLTAKQAEAEAQLQKTTAQFLFQQVASSLTKEAQLELANSLGLIDDASYDAAVAMEGLTTKYDTNHDGVVDAKEATKEYKDEVIALRDAITGMADKTVNVRVNTVYSDSYLDEYRAATGSGRASGGQVSAGGAYIVGEQGPEPFFPETNGYVMNNNDMRDMLAALKSIAADGRGGGGQVFNINTAAPQPGWNIADEVRMLQMLSASA